MIVPLPTVSSHFAAFPRDIQPNSASQLRHTAERFDAWFGRPICAATRSHVEEWLKYLAGCGMAGTTIKGQRANLLQLLRECADLGLCDAIARVSSIRFAQPIPEAWTHDEVRHVYRSTALVDGRRRGSRVRWSDLLAALVLFDYDTGLRPVDLLRFDRAKHLRGPMLALHQHKTGWPLVRKLRTETVEALDKIPLDQPFRMGRRTLFEAFQRLMAAAETFGTPTKIRKTGASLCELHQPGTAPLYLGHRQGVAYNHYVDPRIAGGGGPLPPGLVD